MQPAVMIGQQSDGRQSSERLFFTYSSRLLSGVTAHETARAG
jgi:hypothetical protein